MKNLIVIICLGIFASVFSQEKADLKVVVMNFKKSVLADETVVFESEDKSIKLSGTSNDKGEFKIGLPGGHTYNILVKKIGAEIKNNTITVPKLAPGAQYSEATLSIFFEIPEYIRLENLHFETGKSAIKSGSFAQLDELAEFLKKNSDKKIQIHGHTDNVGTIESNKTLSQKRAEAVKEYLLLKGISIERMKCIGFGSSRPIAPNNNESGRKLNRRTEIRFV